MVPNLLLKYLHIDNKNGSNSEIMGWLRRSKAALRGIKLIDENRKERKHLTEVENTILVHVKEEVDRVLLLKSVPKGYTPMADLQHAYAISKSKLKSCVLKYYQNNGSSAQKKRYDAGQTIFRNSSCCSLFKCMASAHQSLDASQFGIVSIIKIQSTNSWQFVQLEWFHFRMISGKEVLLTKFISRDVMAW